MQDKVYRVAASQFFASEYSLSVDIKVAGFLRWFNSVTKVKGVLKGSFFFLKALNFDILSMFTLHF